MHSSLSDGDGDKKGDGQGQATTLTRHQNTMEHRQTKSKRQSSKGCGPKQDSLRLFSHPLPVEGINVSLQVGDTGKRDVKYGKIKQKAGVEIARDVQEIITSNIHFY